MLSRNVETRSKTDVGSLLGTVEADKERGAEDVGAVRVGIGSKESIRSAPFLLGWGTAFGIVSRISTSSSEGDLEAFLPVAAPVKADGLVSFDGRGGR